MNRLDAIKCVVEGLSGDELIIHANGVISRESFFCADRKENFYLLGSMGLASSVGLGVALGRPERRVLVFDGDGNILMGFGNLAMIGALKPANLIHLVFDNEAYGTTGNQPTLSSRVPLSEAAWASGYLSAAILESRRELLEVMPTLYRAPGPHFLQIKVSREVTLASPRIPYSAREIKERFMGALGN